MNKRVSYISNEEEWVEGFSFSIPVRVRFSETDLFGHMNNTVPFVYFEEARVEFLKSIGAFKEMNAKAKEIPVVADLQCDYHQQIFVDDVLSVAVKIHYLGTTSCDLHYLVRNQRKEVCLTGRGRIVYIHAETGKPVSIPQEIRETFDSSGAVAKG